MPSLPPLDIKTNINHARHVVILGAGASLAAFPNGERNGRQLPLMRNLVEVVGLQPTLAEHGITDPILDFESFYDGLAVAATNPHLVSQIEEQVHAYFSALQLPDEATIYDFLILSLREKDLIATFNWDPFLAQAFRRNVHLKKLPQIIFLHGNVEIGICREHRRKGFVSQTCSTCSMPLTPSRLLFPVKQKDYNTDAFIKSEWETLRWFLSNAYFLTIFGYSAPTIDVEAKNLMLEKWRDNPTMELAEIDIVDIRPPQELESTWHDFFVRQHYAIYDDIFDTYAFRYVRRSCDAFAMATLQQHPWHENPFPRTKDLCQLQEWIQPLLREEEDHFFSGNPCQGGNV
jgi:hypothetical protein